MKNDLDEASYFLLGTLNLFKNDHIWSKNKLWNKTEASWEYFWRKRNVFRQSCQKYLETFSNFWLICFQLHLKQKQITKQWVYEAKMFLEHLNFKTAGHPTGLLTGQFKWKFTRTLQKSNAIKFHRRLYFFLILKVLFKFSPRLQGI